MIVINIGAFLVCLAGFFLAGYITGKKVTTQKYNHHKNA